MNERERDQSHADKVDVPTPRCDALEKEWKKGRGYGLPPNDIWTLARTLERELSSARSADGLLIDARETKPEGKGDVLLLTSSRMWILGDWYRGAWRTHRSEWRDIEGQKVLVSAYREEDITHWTPLPPTDPDRYARSASGECKPYIPVRGDAVEELAAMCGWTPSSHRSMEQYLKDAVEFYVCKSGGVIKPLFCRNAGADASAKCPRWCGMNYCQPDNPADRNANK